MRLFPSEVLVFHRSIGISGKGEVYIHVYFSFYRLRLDLFHTIPCPVCAHARCSPSTDISN